MHSTTAFVLSALASSVLAAETVHNVQVGPSLTFTPDTVQAAEGDWVEFTFGEGHSVAQSTFAAPCVPLSDGTSVYSGFPSDGDVWRIQINSTDPLWLYCSASGHCESGMAMVVNPPSSGNTLDAYKSAAQNAQGSSPANVQGGVFGAASASASGSSSPSASASASGSSSSASSSASASGSSSSASSSGSTSASATSASASAAASPSNGAEPVSVKNGLLFAGAVAAGVAAVL
ncbi:hypothetical protein PV08_03424 [Exophiala spinifera]|uniref:Phytocyanin domain-containing protein n=1 Tax=Exophiala spinifera TaxID=91928 RepID=A0A0D2A2G5_9EURO|nr:uncharacterized protein PV08_03424 [Exophiala spinifera]KIW19132.1 hypothetical protein PV08_03424 [Exophiala spinifera]